MGHRPKHVLIRSLTLQTVRKTVVASVVSFFVSQTVWQRPNAVQASTVSFNLQEAKDGAVRDVCSAVPPNEDQQKRYTSKDNDDLEKRLKGHYEVVLKEQIDDLRRDFNEKLQATDSTLHKEFEDKVQAVREQCQTNINSVNTTLLDSLDHAKSELAEKHRQLDDKLGAMSRTLECSELKQHARSQSEEQLLLKREFEDKLQAVQEQCQTNITSVNCSLNNAKSELKQHVKSQSDCEEQLQTRKRELEDKLLAVQEQCQTNITSVNRTLFKSLDDAKIDMFWYKGVVMVGAVLLCACCLLCRDAGRDPVLKCEQTSQQKPPPIDTRNKNLAVVCFRNSDNDMCRRWTEAITESLTTKPQVVEHVVNSVYDVDRIPACRAALVFVEPDEREMIIENKRDHIGQGLRRLTVERLMDSGVTVFVMIFHDKQPVNIMKRELLNSGFHQTENHAQLQRLKKNRCLVSFGSNLADFQISHVAGQLATCFSTTTQR